MLNNTDVWKLFFALLLFLLLWSSPCRREGRGGKKRRKKSRPHFYLRKYYNIDMILCMRGARWLFMRINSVYQYQFHYISADSAGFEGHKHYQATSIDLVNGETFRKVHVNTHTLNASFVVEFLLCEIRKLPYLPPIECEFSGICSSEFRIYCGHPNL
jgi:hypothetical protein